MNIQITPEKTTHSRYTAISKRLHLRNGAQAVKLWIEHTGLTIDQAERLSPLAFMRFALHCLLSKTEHN